MNKEEIAKLFEDMEYFVDDDFGGHYRSVIGTCEADHTYGYLKIRDYIISLQSQLETSNNKVDKIKEKCKYEIEVYKRIVSSNTYYNKWNSDDMILDKHLKSGYISACENILSIIDGDTNE